MINRAHQHATNPPRDVGALSNYKNLREDRLTMGSADPGVGCRPKIYHLVDGRADSRWSSSSVPARLVTRRCSGS